MPRAQIFDETQVEKGRLVSICDWLPPDFGAVGNMQCSLPRIAQSGWAVMLVALASGEPRREAIEPVGEGHSRSFGYAAPAMKSKGWRSGSSGPSFRMSCS